MPRLIRTAISVFRLRIHMASKRPVIKLPTITVKTKIKSVILPVCPIIIFNFWNGLAYAAFCRPASFLGALSRKTHRMFSQPKRAAFIFATTMVCESPSPNQPKFPKTGSPIRRSTQNMKKICRNYAENKTLICFSYEYSPLAAPSYLPVIRPEKLFWTRL